MTLIDLLLDLSEYCIYKSIQLLLIKSPRFHRVKRLERIAILRVRKVVKTSVRFLKKAR